MKPQNTKKIQTTLLTWYETNGRHHLPWRKTHDPYAILVSELMLQQTQVPRVIPKYNEFIMIFPKIQDLSKAKRTDVLRLWQGLGYNSRAARLHVLANIVTDQCNGKLPTTQEKLLILPGIGPYTAGAIMIFAHNKPAHSIDVNVARVLQRLFWNKHATPKEVDELAYALIQKSNNPHDWQSALMDFGSSICTAKQPLCNNCPLFQCCLSRGVRLAEANAIQKKEKQGKFFGSNRWWRGQIMKTLLLEQQPVKQNCNGVQMKAETLTKIPLQSSYLKNELYKKINKSGKKRFASALQGLADENFIIINNERIQLKE